MKEFNFPHWLFINKPHTFRTQIFKIKKKGAALLFHHLSREREIPFEIPCDILISGIKSSLLCPTTEPEIIFWTACHNENMHVTH